MALEGRARKTKHCFNNRPCKVEILRRRLLGGKGFDFSSVAHRSSGCETIS